MSSDGSGSVAILRRVARDASWCETVEENDPPWWILASGARVSFEPGGQIEVSSARHPTASALIAELTSITTALAEEFERHGIILETRGVDPWNDVGAVPLQLHRERYTTMTRYFESLDPSGVRMMRQTASVQVNVEPGPHPAARWRLVNALSPYLVALFSSSSRYAGKDTGHSSYRAHLWRSLDPSRTGVAAGSDEPVEGYLRFALDAGAMFSPREEGRYASFREWMSDGQRSRGDWDLHLSTLFPEVRPKGFFEIRSTDMVHPRWIAAPIGFVAGLVYDKRTSARAAELLSGSEDSLLARAGRSGLHDPEIASVALELSLLAMAGCTSLGESYLASEDLETLMEFVDRYPRNGRSPADDQ